MYRQFIPDYIQRERAHKCPQHISQTVYLNKDQENYAQKRLPCKNMFHSTLEITSLILHIL